jgi:hypothetical protein
MKHITAGNGSYGAPGGDNKGHFITSHAEEEDL